MLPNSPDVTAPSHHRSLTRRFSPIGAESLTDSRWNDSAPSRRVNSPAKVPRRRSSPLPWVAVSSNRSSRVVEPEDLDEVATALREAAEEVGLDPAECGLRVIGRLPGLWVPVSNFAVTPIVAVAVRRPSMRAQPSEVAAILELPASAILPGAPLVPRERTFRDGRLTYDAYPIDQLPGASPDLVIWGMTARVLGGLGAWLARAADD